MHVLMITCHVIASDGTFIKTGVPKNQINIKGNVKQYNVCNSSLN